MTADLLWIDAAAGIAGDMLLGALLDAGADLDLVRRCVGAVHPDVDVQVAPTTRHHLAATKATVVDRSTGRAADAHHPHEHHHPHRPWREVRDLLAAADLPETVRERAQRTFEVLARAEAQVHGVAPEDVEFHEVGSLDAIGDVVGCCAALVDLAPRRVVCSAVTVGHGDQVLGAHGRIPVPGPAVTNIAITHAVPVSAGPVALEMATPTGMALAAAWADEFGPMPTMTITTTGLGAGTRDPEGIANVVRVVLGRTPQGQAPTQILLETNVDDLDPRLWPGVLADLLDAGAADAWLTPIVMKKGRPAHTLAVLCDPADRATVIGIVAAATTAIGLRETAVVKHTVERELVSVEVDGRPIAVKVARRDGQVVNVQPEFRDVEAYAAAAGLPVKRALARAAAAADALWRPDRS
ncbi:nickel pincer cofactor biosynthesis protein LarC [Raineyella fluvialis]|uniref:Pyridinium-3,5-bisthiocarboxylic acid mononucleotide nickel insertion protein n=1 Tax=Raineyella fluvialis TaxID=2662261 RepID=A0A5Q2F7W9_9ACTN|nr:nickel pincer cofactor biosynthesis protein LarC [Raineyella fluvialis]QGF22929.1 nickel pincer cofactor biosynthesis protein LarC [Raineyella fluvialis]